MSSQETFKPNDIKQCCARLYESDLAKILLGDSLHPGGVGLTKRLGEVLGLAAPSRALDIASGKGASALFLAEHFGCEVIGVDFGERNVEQANTAAAAKGLGKRVSFQIGDAERLRFADSCFDAIICECAFCTFPDKSAAAKEFARVLRSGGSVGISDLTREAVLPKELEGLLAWIACMADARPIKNYVEHLEAAGLRVTRTESHDEALLEMVHQVRGKLLGAEVMVGLKKLDLPGIDFTVARHMAQAAFDAIRRAVWDTRLSAPRRAEMSRFCRSAQIRSKQRECFRAANRP
jgi:ubiquinone/menaquinone biosynthesis C-methylase UbiE